MTAVIYVNLSLEIWGCVTSCIVMACLCLSRFPQDGSKKLYMAMLTFNTSAMFFDALAYLFRGRAGEFAWWGVRLSNFLAYCSNYLLLAAFLAYLTAYLSGRVALSRKPLYTGLTLCAAAIALIVATQFWPLVYSIDAQNMYHRERFFWASQAPAFVGLVMSGALLIRHRRALDRRERLAFGCYVVLPALAMVLQLFVYGLVIASMANTISLLIIFLFLQAEQGQRLEEQRRRLMQNRMSIMLSQIQPHFLFNTLNSIYYLCEQDSAKAQEAIDQFATYLRGNLDSLSLTHPIPFAKELEHTRIYLSLEQMRFGNDLRVVQDVQTTAFDLPPLTLQPLAENAVKHGVGKKAGGGTVTLATREQADCFEVIVSDDGVGFDPDAPIKDDQRSHIGVENVRQRLTDMSGGQLLLTSALGQGTRAVIRIPKSGQTPLASTTATSSKGEAL